jgi:isoleucyl-tRNA synthetase
VVLDLTVTDELLVEGRARDVVRAVQQRRRELGLEVTDRIRLEVAGDAAAVAAVAAHQAWLEDQVLALDTLLGVAASGEGWHAVSLGDQSQATLRITRLPGAGGASAVS